MSQPFQTPDKRLTLLSTTYALMFLVILVLAYQGKLPTFLTQNDKVAHCGLYGVATFLGHRLMNGRRVCCLTLAIPLFPVLFGIFTLTEELCQALSPNRTLDGLDLMASYAGIAIGTWLADKSIHKSKNKQP